MVNEYVSHNRNKLEHGGSILRDLVQKLRDAIIGHRGTLGILYRLVERLNSKI
jgi:hypothetical protein